MINQRSEDLIKSFEKLMLKAYHGAADRQGVFTIGWGHVLTGYEKPDLFQPGQMMQDVKITKERADSLFTDDIEKFIRGVTMRIDPIQKAKLTEDQFGALVSFSYNVGLANFFVSNVRQSVNHGIFDEVPEMLGHFISAAGVQVNGLIRRRAAEAALFKSDYTMLDLFKASAAAPVMIKARAYLNRKEV